MPATKFMIKRRLKDYINYESLKSFLRPLPLQVSGTKDELLQRIEDAINDGTLDYNIFNDYLKEELRYGQNRSVFSTRINPASLQKVKNIHHLNLALKAANIPSEDFSIYTEFYPTEEKPHLVHKETILVGEEVKQLTFCYSNMINIPRATDEGFTMIDDTDYIWITIDVDKSLLNVAIRPRGRNNETSTNTFTLFESYCNLMVDIFTLSYLPNDEMRNTLYNIFKDLTTRAEKPYADRVEPLLEEIEDICKDFSEKLELPSSTNPVNLPFRVKRLLERALIQNDFFRFKDYEEGKIGTIERFYYADDTGARVNAMAGEVGEGIQLRDIYFDTRETIDEQKTFNKVWITWFVPSLTLKKPYTRLEVTSKYLVVHFYSYHTGVEQNYVFSQIEKFKSI